MDLQTQKFQIIQHIVNTNKESLIKKIQEILDQETAISINPMTIEEFYNRIEESEQAYQEGKITAHKDLKEEIKIWRKDR